jgi:hypothetical protein
MTTIDLDTDLVASRHDPQTRMNYYTIERGWRRWTVGVHSDDLDQLGPLDDEVAKRRRCDRVTSLLELATQGVADGEI